MKVGFFGGNFLPPHKGHEYVIKKASQMCDELYVILFHCKQRGETSFSNGNIKRFSYQHRLRWLKQMTSDMGGVKVLHIEDDADSDESYDWEDGASRVKKLIGKKIDYVFGSERSYEQTFDRLYPTSKYVIVDENRESFPISSTKIRNEGVYKHWNYLPEAVKPFFARKIVVSGTESCGKSTLVEKLAREYNTTFVEEYGRNMSLWSGGDDVITPELFPYIAYGHKMLEFEKIKHANKVMFIDTDVVVTKYYLELYSNIKDDLYDEIARHQDYDLVVLLSPDVEWIDDGLRRHGGDKQRWENHKKMKEMYDDLKIDYVQVGGSYENRFEEVKSRVDKLIE